MKTLLISNHKNELVLTKALLNLMNAYDLTGKILSDITGISESGVTRLNQGKKFISPNTKEGEICLLLIRIYRSLNTLVGHHLEKAKLWLNEPNHYFHQKPIEHMKTLAGLVDVLHYLDAMRGKL